MPDLGNKHDCFSCGTKFYDLGRSEPVCPKCGANQKDARKQESAPEPAAPRRRRRDEVVRDTESDQDDDSSSGDGDFGDDELVAPEGVDGEDDGDDDSDDDFDDED